MPKPLRSERTELLNLPVKPMRKPRFVLTEFPPPLYPDPVDLTRIDTGERIAEGLASMEAKMLARAWNREHIASEWVKQTAIHERGTHDIRARKLRERKGVATC